MNVSRWLPTVAVAHALAADAVDPDTGQQRPRKSWQKVLPVIGAIGLVLNPAVTIASVTVAGGAMGASARLTNTRDGVASVALWIQVIVGCVVLVVVPAPAWWSPLPILLIALAVTAVGSLWKPVTTARRIPGPATHVLSDMVRHPEAPAGTGRDLLNQLATDQERVIVGVAHSPMLWAKVYAAHAERVDPGDVNKPGFRLTHR